jgi:LysM repeat protein
MKRRASMALALVATALLIVGGTSCERSVPEPATPTVVVQAETAPTETPPPTPAVDADTTVISVLPDGVSAGTPTATIAWDLATATPTIEPTAVDTATPVPSTNTPVPPVGDATATPGQLATLAPETVTYVVQAGDTLYGIASYYEITVAQLMQANGLTSEFIRAGSELTIPKAQPGGATAPTTQTYTVVVGDTLYGIALKFGVSADAIAQANGIYNPAFINVGDRLTIPSGGTTSVGSPQVHVVQNGDTLSGIAARYGSTADAIARANGLANPNFLRIGQRLTIPAN